MARTTIITLSLATALCGSGAALAQTTTYQTVTQPAQVQDANIVRAQFIRPGDVSPEEYQRLLDEADRVKGWQSQGTTLNASTTTFSQPSQQIQLYDAPLSNTVTYGSGTTYSTIPAHSTVTTPSTSYNSGTSYSNGTASYPSTTYQGTTYQGSTYQGSTYGSTLPASSTYTAPQISHSVVKGDTLYNISKRYGVGLGNLKQVNGLSGNIISIGQVLTVPSVQKSIPTQATYTAPRATTYQSQPYQSQNFTGTSYQSFGTVQPSTTYVRNVEPVPPAGVYAVLPQDTLYSISKFACVDVNDLERINGITNVAALQPGQKLAMPAGHCLR